MCSFGLYSGTPLVWFNNSRTVIVSPSLPLPVTTPGSQCPTVSSSDSLPSPTSCNSVTATNVFVKLPILNSASHGTGVRFATSPKPLRTLITWPGVSTRTSTPGAPWLSNWSASCCSAGVDDVPDSAPATPPTVVAAASAATTNVTSEILRRFMA